MKMPRAGNRLPTTKHSDTGGILSITSPSEAAAKGPILLASPGFTAWLAGAGASLALSTYQAGRLMFLGLHAARP